MNAASANATHVGARPTRVLEEPLPLLVQQASHMCETSMYKFERKASSTRASVMSSRCSTARRVALFSVSRKRD